MCSACRKSRGRYSLAALRGSHFVLRYGGHSLFAVRAPPGNEIELSSRLCFRTIIDHVERIIRTYPTLGEMKADEYRYWQSRPVHERMDAVAKLTISFYTMKDGTTDAPRFQRVVEVLQRPRR